MWLRAKIAAKKDPFNHLRVERDHVGQLTAISGVLENSPSALADELGNRFWRIGLSYGRADIFEHIVVLRFGTGEGKGWRFQLCLIAMSLQLNSHYLPTEDTD
jgi:hypothetical protein